MTRQEIAEGIIAYAETVGITLSANGHDIVAISSNGPPSYVLSELMRSCKDDIAAVLNASVPNPNS